MPFPTIEIVYAPATDSYKGNATDQSPWKPACEVLKNTDGHIKTRVGLQHEDRSTAYMFVAWESVAHHMALMNDENRYGPMKRDIQAVMDLSSLEMYHIECEGDPYPALAAPATELATFTLYEDKTQEKDALIVLVKELVELIRAEPPEAGATGPVWGPIAEKDNVIGFMLGWTSPQAHIDLVRNEPYLDIRRRFEEISRIDVHHVPLASA